MGGRVTRSRPLGAALTVFSRSRVMRSVSIRGNTWRNVLLRIVMIARPYHKNGMHCYRDLLRHVHGQLPFVHRHSLYAFINPSEAVTFWY